MISQLLHVYSAPLLDGSTSLSQEWVLVVNERFFNYEVTLMFSRMFQLSYCDFCLGLGFSLLSAISASSFYDFYALCLLKPLYFVLYNHFIITVMFVKCVRFILKLRRLQKIYVCSGLLPVLSG